MSTASFPPLPVLVLNHSIRCFYVDSPSNARANGMQIKPNLKNEDAIVEECVSPIQGGRWGGPLTQTNV